MDMEKHRGLKTVSIFSLLILILSSCSASPPSPTPTSIALPSPTPIPPAATSITLIPMPVIPTSTPVCVNGLSFVSDTTIPDGTIVTAGSSLDKQWLVQNSGSCNWDERYRVRLVSGDALGAAVEQSLYPARAGAQATLRILFTAPAEAGEYVSEWQAFDFDGIPFGDTFFIKITVQ